MLLSCYGQIIEEDICAQIMQKNDSEETLHPESNDDQDDDALASSTLDRKHGEAMQAMHMLRHFLETIEADFKQSYELESQLLQFVATNSTQTSIRDFVSLPSLCAEYT